MESGSSRAVIARSERDEAVHSACSEGGLLASLAITTGGADCFSVPVIELALARSVGSRGRKRLLICPSGLFRNQCPAPPAKVFPFAPDPNQFGSRAVPPHRGALATSRTRGGM